MARKKDMSRHYEEIFEELMDIARVAKKDGKYKEAITSLQLANFVCITEASMNSSSDVKDLFISNKLSNGLFIDYFDEEYKDE